MKFFGKNKSKKDCCCQNITSENLNQAEVLKNTNGIKVLGSGCMKCRTLEENVKSALKELGMDATIDHVTDFAQIASYGVMSTPALVIDGKVVSYGKVLNKEEAKMIILKVGNKNG